MSEKVKRIWVIRTSHDAYKEVQQTFNGTKFPEVLSGSQQLNTGMAVLNELNLLSLELPKEVTTYCVLAVSGSR